MAAGLRRASGIAAAAVLIGLTWHFAGNSTPERPAPVSGAEVDVLMDGAYFPALHEALGAARRSIVCVMYRAAYNPAKPKHRETILIEDLVAAHKRGVVVEAVFDANKTYWEKSPEEREKIEEKNKEAIARLREAGVPVAIDGLDRVTHAKVVVIDGETVFLGSANWTGAALKDNHEANVRIRSKEVAAQVLEALKKIDRSPAK